MEEDFNLWGHGASVEVTSSDVVEEVICGLESSENLSYNSLETEHIIPITDQAAAENLMFLSQDVNYAESAALADEEFVTEEVITDDWVVPDGQERVEVPLDQLDNINYVNIKIENDIDVSLPTDQDEYTAMRPWPCDFCSRRFRKKAALMNHMVAHQKDRPHSCNLCGVRYICKSDLMMHLKIHAYVPDHVYDETIEEQRFVKQKKKRGRRRKIPEPVQEDNDDSWENMTSARTQQWSRGQRRPSPPRTPPTPPTPPSPPTPPPPADPRRPFVCKHCGVGFAREKALQSHSRVHGGDSPLECSACGELCWSREALASHTRSRHPNLPQAAVSQSYDDDNNSDDDIDYRASPQHNDSGSDHVVNHHRDVKGPELYCQDCGVAFQRADLLRRHVTAAHSHKRQSHYSSSAASEGGAYGEQTCDVCGETCTDALQLLAHAEGHARTSQPNTRIKRSTRGRHNNSALRQFPCKECGKVFGSRSSQQIHVRIHTGERPYPCRFCWKAFADGGTLRKHERIHTGEKPYACAVCPRAFNQRVVLREHVRSHHSAPNYQAANGASLYECPVCDHPVPTSSELVQHLIQHCDDNTAIKRKPQLGYRKYKRRKPRPKSESPPSSEWPELSASPPPSPAPPRRRRGRGAAPPRPRMIHTERSRPPGRPRKPPRRPADDLLALRPPALPPAEPDSPPAPPAPPAPPPYKCEMCSQAFRRSDDLLRHVAVHI